MYSISLSSIKIWVYSAELKKNHNLNQNCSNCNLIFKEETISYVINYLQIFQLKEMKGNANV